jgi:hypothetical protein
LPSLTYKFTLKKIKIHGVGKNCWRAVAASPLESDSRKEATPQSPDRDYYSKRIYNSDGTSSA